METLDLSNAILVRDAAIQMAYRRLETEADPALLPIGETWGWAVSVAIRTIVEQMREAVVTKQTRAMVVHRENLLKLCDNHCQQIDVQEVINVIVKYDGRKGWESLVEGWRTCGGEGFSGQLKPAEAVRKLKKARADGLELSNLSQQETDALFLESRLWSLTSTVSQLRCWKDYATGVLLYKDDCTLPPRSTQHVLMWINIFRNGQAAGNYFGSLRWACKMRDLSAGSGRLTP